MIINDFFDERVFSMNTDDLLADADSLIESMVPENKELKDFTGGYVQQLKNSVQFVAYFGTKVGSNNRDSVKVDIEPDEMDMMYAMLKVKIHSMRTNKKNKVSLMKMSAERKRKSADSNW